MGKLIRLGATALQNVSLDECRGFYYMGTLV